MSEEVRNKRKPRRLMTPAERLERRIRNATRKMHRYTKRGKTGLAHRYRVELDKLHKKFNQLPHPEV